MLYSRFSTFKHFQNVQVHGLPEYSMGVWACVVLKMNGKNAASLPPTKAMPGT